MMNEANGKAGRNRRRKGQSPDDYDSDKEEALLEEVLTVHYPSSVSTRCQMTLTESSLILEECEGKEEEGDGGDRSDDGSGSARETYPIKDLFGFHIVRRTMEEPGIRSVYACVIFYTLVGGDKIRTRVARILEFSGERCSYQQNLEGVKEWSLQIGRLLNKSRQTSKGRGDHEEEEPTVSVEDKIKKNFEELIALDKEDNRYGHHHQKPSNGVGGKKEKEGGEKDDDHDDGGGGGIDLEFDTAAFSLVKSVLFPRRFLVIVNPVSGQGKGASLVKEYILPVFADSGIEVDLLMTQHAGHARSHIAKIDLSNLDGIISVGGDGLLNEIVNGLRSKESAEHSGKFAKLPIGVVATGSGNGVARSMADYSKSKEEYLANPTLHSTLACARGSIVPINLTEVSLDKKVLHSFLSVGWGLMSDIDIESEVLRSIGEIRFFIWSFLKLAKLKCYKAELSYIPYDASGTVCSRVKVDDEFVCVYSACQSYIGSYMLFAPDAKRNDKVIHLAYLPSSTGRLAAAKFLLKLDGGGGTHLQVPPVKYVKVKEFTLRCDGGMIEGCLTMDGEQVKGSEITVKLCDSPLNVLSMG